MTLQDVTYKLLTRRIVPTLVEPELNITIKSLYDEVRQTDQYEPGDKNIPFRLSYEFIQNDSGSLTSVLVRIISYKDGLDEVQSEEEIDIYGLEYYDFYKDIYDGKSFEVIVTAAYEAGDYKTDNFGSHSDGKNITYNVKNGTIVKSHIIEGKRKSFIGKSNTNIRQAKAIDTPTKSFTMEVKGYQDMHHIIMAFPKTENVDVYNIFYKNQGCDVSNLFDISVREVSGANNYKPIEYDVYHLYCEGDLDDTLYFDVTLGRDKL